MLSCSILYNVFMNLVSQVHIITYSSQPRIIIVLAPKCEKVSCAKKEQKEKRIDHKEHDNVSLEGQTN